MTEQNKARGEIVISPFMQHESDLGEDADLASQLAVDAATVIIYRRAEEAAELLDLGVDVLIEDSPAELSSGPDEEQ
jgi:hypothetical protein